MRQDIQMSEKATHAVAEALRGLKVDCTSFLDRCGFQALDNLRWNARQIDRQTRGEQPRLTMQVRGHKEALEHTWYAIHCQLSVCPRSGIDVSWMTYRRLEHLRTGLHDPLEDLLDKDYADIFKGAPFALRGGLQGTTARLDAWFTKLASAISQTQLPPAAVALCLRFLDVSVGKLGVPEFEEPHPQDKDPHQSSTGVMPLTDSIPLPSLGSSVAQSLAEEAFEIATASMHSQASDTAAPEKEVKPNAQPPLVANGTWTEVPLG